VNKIPYYAAILILGWGVLWSCAFDTTLREYLSAQFWMPFSKAGSQFARKNVPRLSKPYAGMQTAQGATPLSKLRAAYQGLADLDSSGLKRALAAARAVPNLNPEEREEVELLDAKFDMRAGSKEQIGPLLEARSKLQRFLRTARTPAYLSEARGWLAYTHYLVGEQSAAGKIYLDELNRSGSNLSRQVLLNSLRLNYGYDGGSTLREQLHEYFDTPEHAAFAIHLVTNPQWSRLYSHDSAEARDEPDTLPYARIKTLLEKHAGLLRSERGANALALLGMRTALRAGDPPAALRLAANIPARAAIHAEPDFLWMLASARFLSKDFAGAEAPLLRLFESPRASNSQKAAAAYGLCGVYRKTENPVEQLRFALWLNAAKYPEDVSWSGMSRVDDQSIYWASSGWDRSMLLDAEAPVEALRAFAAKYPGAPDLRLVRYSLAVRLAREDRYEEAALLFDAVNARLRTKRMREMAALYGEAARADAIGEVAQEAKFKLAAYLSNNSDRIYFNDRLWTGHQRYALSAGQEQRFTREERLRQIGLERKLKDEQEELWRAHLILRDVVRDSGPADLGRRAAVLAIQCLRRLSDRFERSAEIRTADIELTRFLRRAASPRLTKRFQ